MRRGWPLFTLMLLLTGGFALRAGDTPEQQLEHARKLREGKQPEAALAILEKLAKDSPPSQAVTVAIELARTRAQIALREDVEQRPAYLLKVRAGLTALASDPKTADPEAILEAARIDAFLGKAVAQQARLADDPRGAENLLSEADGHFTKAAK